MALVTISGYPCSGKTTRALKIKEGFEQRIGDSVYQGPVNRVILISDDMLGLSRDAYDGMPFSLKLRLSDIRRILQTDAQRSHREGRSSRRCRET
jgi:tRNA uridine 5-carbamoylmethylation protein Kti12